MAQKFADEIIKAIVSKYYDETRDYIGISQIPYCELKLYRDVKRGRKQDVPAHVLQRMFIGTAAHKGMEELLLWYAKEKNAQFIPVDTESEIVIRDERGVPILKGHFDFLFIWKTGRKTGTLVDFKFIGHNHFRMIEKRNEAPAHYVDQMYLYAYAINEEKENPKFKDFKVTDCLLVMIDIDPPPRKEGLYIKEFRFRTNKKRALELIEKKIHLDKCLAEGMEPEKPFESPDESWECNYCDYYEECWGAQLKLKSKGKGKKLVPDELAKRYIELKSKKDEIEQQMEEVRQQITEMIGEYDAMSKDGALIIKYIPEKIKQKEEVDLDKLKAFVNDNEILSQVIKVKEKKTGGYHKFDVKKTK